MPLSTQVDERGFIRLMLEGSWPSVDELKTARAEADAGGHDTSRVLIDIRRVVGPLPKFLKIREDVSAFDLNDPQTQSRKRAVVVQSDVQFGVARTFQAILPGRMEVFRDEASAIAWLLSA